MLLYKLITPFIPFSSYEFEIVANFLYSIFVLIIIWLSLRLYFGKIDLKNMVLRTALVAICFFTTSAWCHMQTEMSCTLLIMLAYSLWVNVIKNEEAGKWKLFVAGVLIGSTFFFKSILILLSVSVVAAIGIYNIYNNYKFSAKRFWIVVLGSISILVVNMGLILLINPLEIQSMVDASAFQSTLFSTRVSLKTIVRTFCCNILRYSFYIPVMAVGILAFVCNFIRSVKRKEWKLTLFHSVMWLMPFFIVILSDKYYGYHFITFVFPSIIEIVKVFHRKSQVESCVMYISTLGVGVIYIFLMSIFSNNFREYIDITQEVLENNEETFNLLNIDKSAMFLYLDDGKGSYFVGNESYLSYYYPLPLRRLDEESTLECYTSSMEKVLNYDGKYISVYENWFFKDGSNTKIRTWLENEYEYIGSYKVFAPWNRYPSPGKMQAISYDIYVRK